MKRIFFQLSKYLTVGALNTIVDFGILNMLMLVTGITSGIGYAAFKGTSVAGAVLNSYYFNKYWTFRAYGEIFGSEFIKFASVSAVGFLLNVGIAAFIVNMITSPPGISPILWANFGAASAAASTTLWNFFGYKYLVFRRKNS